MVHLKAGQRDPPVVDGALGVPVSGLAASPPVDDLTVHVACSVAALAGLEHDFERLQAGIANTLPFSTYEWHMSWCRHFLDQGDGIIDEPMFHIVRESGRCVAIVPLIRTVRRLRRFNVSSLGMLGADPAITEIRASLVLPGYEERVAAALSLRLSTARDWDWIQWIGACDKFAAALTHERSLRWQPLAPSYLIDLPATWEHLRASLKRNIRESLRHCYNSLKRDGHRFELRVIARSDQTRAALDKLFELHGLRAHMPNTVTHPNRFASPVVREFMYDVCEAFATRGDLRIFQLEIAGSIVASRIGFVVGDSLYLYYSGFDPAWSRYSVMTTVVAEAIKYAIAAGLKTVNLSPGNDISKTRWGAREVPHQTAYEHSGRLRSRLVRHAYLKARSGEGLQGWLLQRLMPGRRSWN